LHSSGFALVTGEKEDEKGQWKQSNGGFEIRFKDETLLFGRQELVFSAEPICKETISQMKFATTNPYKLKGECIRGEFKIVNVLSATEAFAYDVKYKINPYSFQVSGEKRGDKAVKITAKGSLSDDFAKGVKIKGVFIITGTEKAVDNFGSELTVNTLEMISKE